MSEILPPVYVLIDRPEGYEDVCADLVIEDALNSGWCRENVVHDATGEVAALRAENDRLTAACRMVLLFYNAGYWTKANADEWANVTGETDATTRVLCDTVRRALDPPALAPADAGKEER